MKVKGAETKRREIIEEFVGKTGKRVFLVEGESDRDAFSEMLEKKLGSELEKKWLVAPAGGKRMVIGILSRQPDWIGLVDRDEWTMETISQITRDVSNLHILPRFCLENYVVEPGELWRALPKNQRDKIDGGLERLRKEILVDLGKWIRHGVLRTVITPLWDGLIARGFQGELLDFENAQDDEKIKGKLEEWHHFLRPDVIFGKFKERLHEVREKPPFEQITRWVDGKEFFRVRVYKALNRLLGQQSEKAVIRQLFSRIDPPEDLDSLWGKFEL